MPGLLVTAILLAALMASPARAATLVYVGNAESNEIHVLQLDRMAGRRAAASPGLDGSPECSLEPPTREQSARRRVDARERPRQRVQVRRRHRHAGAGLAPVRPREGKGRPATFRLPSERQARLRARDRKSVV